MLVCKTGCNYLFPFSSEKEWRKQLGKLLSKGRWSLKEGNLLLFYYPVFILFLLFIVRPSFTHVLSINQEICLQSKNILWVFVLGKVKERGVKQHYLTCRMMIRNFLWLYQPYTIHSLNYLEELWRDSIRWCFPPVLCDPLILNRPLPPCSQCLKIKHDKC